MNESIGEQNECIEQRSTMHRDRRLPQEHWNISRGTRSSWCGWRLPRLLRDSDD